MKKAIIAMITILLFVVYSDFANARVRFIPKSELMQKADLVISGKVIKLEQTEYVETGRERWSGRIMYATIQIEKVIKGNIDGQYVIVEFIEIYPYLEPDVQGAQFGNGSKGTVYLKKLPNNHYNALGGWINVWTK